MNSLFDVDKITNLGKHIPDVISDNNGNHYHKIKTAPYCTALVYQQDDNISKPDYKSLEKVIIGNTLYKLITNARSNHLYYIKICHI